MSSSARITAMAGLVVAAFLGFLSTGCDDRTPPYCVITGPADSAVVSGTVGFSADASDTNGVLFVDFFVDNNMLASDTFADYAVDWETDGLEDGSWHRLHAVAYDWIRNPGYSDTISVQIRLGGQRSVYHGDFDLPHARFLKAGFRATAEDTLVGEMRVAGGGLLTLFAWLDAANFRQFSETGQYSSAEYEQQNVAELTLRQAVPREDSFYLVFANSSGSQLEIWTRFTLE